MPDDTPNIMQPTSSLQYMDPEKPIYLASSERRVDLDGNPYGYTSVVVEGVEHRTRDDVQRFGKVKTCPECRRTYGEGLDWEACPHPDLLDRPPTPAEHRRAIIRAMPWWKRWARHGREFLDVHPFAGGAIIVGLWFLVELVVVMVRMIWG